MNKCPHCGAEVQFKPGTQKVHCEYCGSDFNPKELVTKTKKAKKSVDTFQGKTYSCTQCGATLMTFDETAITFCSYCGSQGMLEDKMSEQNCPDLIIPFKKTKEQCIENYKRKVASSLFCPNYLKSDIVVNKFRGIYMPYGIYKVGYHGECTNKGSKYSHRAGDYIIYNDYTIHSQVDASYDGISYDLLSKFYDDFSLAIPFNYQEAEPFNKNYLAGFYADAKDVAEDMYAPRAISMATNDSYRFMNKKREFHKYGCSHPVVPFNLDSVKTGFFPVYFLAIRDKNEKYLHYAVINGQTGKVAADLPISFIKYLLASIIVAVPIFFILSGLPVVIPVVINMFAVGMSIIAWILCYSQYHQIKNRENHANDIGYQSVHNEKKQNSFGFFKYLWKILLAIAISMLPIFKDLVNDLYFYTAAVISMSLLLWSFFDLVKLHNLTVSSKIPQLEKRGGDEHE